MIIEVVYGLFSPKKLMGFHLMSDHDHFCRSTLEVILNWGELKHGKYRRMKE
jgi:hypothetical protein